jgi:hypothetical protein
MHSVQARDVQQQRRARRDTLEAQRVETKRNETQILDLIDKERAELPTRLWELVNPKTSKEEMENTKLALQLYDKKLYEFRNKVAITLRKEPLDVYRSFADE